MGDEVVHTFYIVHRMCVLCTQTVHHIIYWNIAWGGSSLFFFSFSFRIFFIICDIGLLSSAPTRYYYFHMYVVYGGDCFFLIVSWGIWRELAIQNDDDSWGRRIRNVCSEFTFFFLLQLLFVIVVAILFVFIYIFFSFDFYARKRRLWWCMCVYCFLLPCAYIQIYEFSLLVCAHIYKDEEKMWNNKKIIIKKKKIGKKNTDDEDE